jgi:hypothetical protein
MNVNNVNVGYANGYANTQQANNRHNVQKVSKTPRAEDKKAHHAQETQKVQSTQKAQSAQKAQQANNTQNTVFNKVRINAQELFKTMTVTPAKTSDQNTQNAGGMGKANGNKPATPPGATVKTAELATKDIDEFLKAYKNIARFQTVDQESGILELSNRMEIISYLYWKVEAADLNHPLGNTIHSNLRITQTIDGGGDVRIEFNPVP